MEFVFGVDDDTAGSTIFGLLLSIRDNFISGQMRAAYDGRKNRCQA